MCEKTPVRRNVFRSVELAQQLRVGALLKTRDIVAKSESFFSAETGGMIKTYIDYGDNSSRQSWMFDKEGNLVKIEVRKVKGEQLAKATVLEKNPNAQDKSVRQFNLIDSQASSSTKELTAYLSYKEAEAFKFRTPRVYARRRICD